MFRSKESIALILFLLISVTAQAEVVTVEAIIKSVDAKARTITVQRKAKTTELDVSRKAKITLLGKDATLESLEVGQTVELTYHTDLEIVPLLDIR